MIWTPLQNWILPSFSTCIFSRSNMNSLLWWDCVSFLCHPVPYMPFPLSLAHCLPLIEFAYFLCLFKSSFKEQPESHFRASINKYMFFYVPFAVVELYNYHSITCQSIFLIDYQDILSTNVEEVSWSLHFPLDYHLLLDMTSILGRG